MPLPLLAVAALRLGAGSAVRAGATRVGAGQAANGVKGRLVSQAVGHYGVNALQNGAQNRRQPRQDHGITQHIRENPGEALVGGIMMSARTNTLSDTALANTNALLQSTQFHQGP